MSGGFFRGTSADQDTRFSNKQAKLMKSQKFAAELEHLVDMTKVKMDVIRPWIANRVTELLGFEDEVLINFIYGLLDGKEVNGKQVQISLTGFMEKNTGKFMKELWTLLLSAQKNASGVPQQFLDAKEEETREKKLEADRIANEIQKKKEKESRERDQERLKKMDGAVEMKAAADALDPNTKTMLAKDASIRSEDGKGPGERNGVRGRSRVSRSPQSAGHSPSPHRGSPSRSVSKSHSNSRDYSGRKSRSMSRSPNARRRSISSDRVHHSLRRRSITPRRRHSPRFSPSPRRRPSYLRRRSRSRSLRRSPSPFRRRLHSPFRRKSPSPMRRRSPSPVRRRRSPSPIRRRRSPSPVRRRRSPSPVRRRRSPSPIRRRRSPSLIRRRRSPSPIRRRRSPSPIRRRRSPSPIRRRRSPSPIRRRRSPSPMGSESLSPVQRGSPSPVRRRSPSPVHRTSLSPVRRRYQRSPLTPQHRSTSPIHQRSPVPARMRPQTPSRHRSPSPYESSSPSPPRRRTLSPIKRKSPNDYRRSPVQSPGEKIRVCESFSPAARRRSSSLRSPPGESKNRNDLRKMSAFSPSPERSPTVSESPPRATRKRSASEDRRSLSPYESPGRQTWHARIHYGSLSPPQKPREKPRQGGPDTSKEEKDTNRTRDHKSVSSRRSMQKEEYSPDRVASDRHPPESRSQPDKIDLRKKNQDLKSEKSSGRGDRPQTFDQERSPTLPGERQQSSYPGESKKSDERNHSRSSNGKESDQRRKSANATMVVEKVDHGNRSDSVDSGSEESYKHRADNKEKRKHKYEREEVASDDDYSYDSETERKHAKRRRKEEKKLRKEEKRRRRDERRRRKEERRAEKHKLKNRNDADGSDGEHISRRESHPSDDEVTESEQKRLEIELRNKALESIKAKKINSR
ncbi:serine/arginine repetitive matrix protein 1 isoform X2 [Pistacia vera]|uniref:serine/arginine repetitive matrix protein 1 isoform X2 n=1 Tax=Pistacia vera TaxID=55513 RepID=UPI0012632EA5|nr:serine/arginine repetitive matrix protein 1 isoform X2 [Pistacia vera]